jgi:NitT/TauT family transport system permease protein
MTDSATTAKGAAQETDAAPAAGHAPVPRRRLTDWVWRRVAGAAPPVLAIVILLVVWQLVVQLGHVKVYILPTPLQVVQTMWDQAPVLLTNTWTTLQEILVGLGLSVAIGVPLAVLIVGFKPAEGGLYPLLVSSQVIPKVALAPLFLVWFGFGLLSKVIMVFLITFFPIVIDTAVGLRGIEIENLYLARSMGANSLQTLLRFRMPQALPNMFGGFNLAATLSVIGAIVGELVGAARGLGYII